MDIHSIYHLVSGYFRRRRMEQFRRAFDVTDDTIVLDIGGDFFNWTFIESAPKLTIMNLYMPKKRPSSDINWVVADARHLPFKNQSFQIAYSNSVIEHLSNYENQQSFAHEVVRVGRGYYIQTPNRWFVIEPHFLTPFIHWVPRRWRAKFLRNFTVWGWIGRPSRKQCQKFVEEIRLLDAKEVRALFPGSRLIRERLLGYTKSLIALETD